MSEISPTRIGLLAVAEPPKGAPSVGDWVPFPPGKSLNEIIRTCNAECSVSYDQSNMLPDFKERREVLDLRPYDLGTLDDVGTDELKHWSGSTGLNGALSLGADSSRHSSD